MGERRGVKRNLMKQVATKVPNNSDKLRPGERGMSGVQKSLERKTGTPSGSNRERKNEEKKKAKIVVTGKPLTRLSNKREGQKGYSSRKTTRREKLGGG